MRRSGNLPDPGRNRSASLPCSTSNATSDTCPDDLARPGIHQMHSLARAAGDRLVLFSTRMNLFGRPALHVLARVRTTEEESAHRENGSTIDLYQFDTDQEQANQFFPRLEVSSARAFQASAISRSRTFKS